MVDAADLIDLPPDNERQYVSDEQKQDILRQLNMLIQSGVVDADMIPWLEKLNKLNGVVSTFCCTGHRNGWLGYIAIQVNKNIHSFLTTADIDYNRFCLVECRIGPGYAQYNQNVAWMFYWRANRTQTCMTYIYNLLKRIK